MEPSLQGILFYICILHSINTVLLILSSQVVYKKILYKSCHSSGFPSSTCNCGCKLTKSSGTISSIHKPNNVVTCIWFIETKPGSAITLRINRADHFDWTNGAIYVAGQQKFHKFSSQFGSRMSNSLPIVIKSTSNQLNVTLHHNKAAENNMQPFVVEASYTAGKHLHYYVTYGQIGHHTVSSSVSFWLFIYFFIN